MTERRNAYRNEAPSPPVDALIAELAKRQHGIVTLEQLEGLGMSRAAVRRRVLAGRLFQMHRGVYAVGYPARSRDALLTAAALAAGVRSGVGYFASIEVWNVSRWPPSRVIDVVSLSQRRPAGVRVHTARQLDARDLTRHRNIPVTTIERTLVDLTDVMTPYQLAFVIHEAAFRGLFDLAATRAAIERANGRRHLKRLERAIELHLSGSAGTRSAKEDAYLASLPADQQTLVRVNTKIEPDFHWPEQQLVVEIDGSGHGRPPTQAEDAERDARLEHAGIEVRRIAAR